MKRHYQFEGGELNGQTHEVEIGQRVVYHAKEPKTSFLVSGGGTEGMEVESIQTPDVEVYIYDLHSGKFLEESLATPEMQRWRFYSLKQAIADILVAGGEGVLDLQEREVIRNFEAEIAVHTIEVMQRIGVNPDAVSYLLQENTRLRAQIKGYPVKVMRALDGIERVSIHNDERGGWGLLGDPDGNLLHRHRVVEVVAEIQP